MVSISIASPNDHEKVLMPFPSGSHIAHISSTKARIVELTMPMTTIEMQVMAVGQTTPVTMGFVLFTIH